MTLDAGRFAPVAAMLGVSPLREGDELPPAWHFPLFGCATPRDQLRPDAFPGFGVPLAHPEFPRLLAGGRAVHRRVPLRIGATLDRRSEIVLSARRQGASGEMLKLAVRHSLCDTEANLPIVEETQEFLLLGGRYAPRPNDARPPAGTRHIATFTPDATMLFQYSALSFNSHKIHLDRRYAEDVEGYPHLLVNGGLTTLLICEAARTSLGLQIAAYTVRNRAPLFCDQPISIFVDDAAEAGRLFACGPDGAIAAEMEISRHGI